ncbi:dynamin family protein [Chromatocurvus halotolerans]|uniref:Dynamin family protein n=1 Tax=Chromatocurvus halotolerans TaxID=1132028 RepID=A0A4R2KQM2_9GAMM|nr:dynamin family protein [Chromatocurvus halotolerans]TCO73229.1 dynamin family protein [Chromatocurvus halotolerans]
MATTATEERIKRLKHHLELENPALSQAVQYFQELDAIARRIGFISHDDSYATQISWWPVVAVLGTFSAGKSTFLNEYLGIDLQRTGNQAIDDKFTVICYGDTDQPRQLPGLALDADPRFPFYQISEQVEAASKGEGKRVDSFLQLKTCRAESLRGKIMIDSPGFDADEQRSSTLLITDHIIGLSDLVLVFFDARHPEPGAMMDTLKHLVVETIDRSDSDKFLYILNQIDNTAREDNPEEVVAAWQRALAQSGLTAGRFYRTYSESAVVPIEDEQKRLRMQAKRDEDLGEIRRRIEQLNIERAYRVTGMLEHSCKHLRDVMIPRLIEARNVWMSRNLWTNVIVFGLAIGLFLYVTITGDAWDGFTFLPLAGLDTTLQLLVGLGVAVLVLFVYSRLRRLAGQSVLRRLQRDDSLGSDKASLVRAFETQLGAVFSPLLPGKLAGWSARVQKKLDKLIGETDRMVQALNDQYTQPSGVEPKKR